MVPAAPPPPTRMHEGSHAHSHFLGKGVYFWPQSREAEKTGKGGVFVTANGNHAVVPEMGGGGVSGDGERA